MTPQQMTASIQLLRGILAMTEDAHFHAQPWAVLAWTEKLRDVADDLADELLDDLRREIERERSTS